MTIASWAYFQQLAADLIKKGLRQQQADLRESQSQLAADLIKKGLRHYPLFFFAFAPLVSRRPDQKGIETYLLGPARSCAQLAADLIKKGLRRALEFFVAGVV